MKYKPDQNTHENLRFTGRSYRKNKKTTQQYNSKVQLDSSPSKLNPKVFILKAN